MLGDLIKRRRLARHMTQAALARVVGYSQPYIVRLENGDIRRPSLEALQRFSRALDIPFVDLSTATGLPIADSQSDSAILSNLTGKLASNRELAGRLAHARSQRSPEQWAAIEERLAALCGSVLLQGVELAELPEAAPAESRAKRRDRVLALTGIAADRAADVAEHHDRYLAERDPHGQ